MLVGPCVPANAFDLRDVVAKAKALAARPYQAPTPIPKFLRELSFDEYQGIRFNPDRSLWRSSRARFQVMLVPPGLYYTHAVRINVVDGTGVHRIP
ncbi:MAG: glucan biosynthesis protein, partial [Gammaproteobacteria bacterium]